MSSMRNAVNRRPHKERSQPQAREKWGILEKHKDYSLRAQDYNVKKKKLAQLSQKAREKNPDEFAFGMLSQGRAGLGKHKSNGDASVPLSHDTVKLLKTQDAGYLRTVAAKTRKEIDRLTEEVGTNLAGSKGSGRKTSFTDQNDQPAPSADRGKKRDAEGEVLVMADRKDHKVPAEHETTSPAHQDPNVVDAPAPKAKSKKALAAEQTVLSRLQAERKRRKRLQEMRVAKLEVLKTRQREVLMAADRLELQRAKMAHTVGGVNRSGVKFKIRERKK